jgi:uncharacterized protein
MSIKDKLLEDMKAAMKEKESGKLRLSVIRMARAAIKNIEINKKRELDDEETLEVLARDVKQRRDSIDEFKKADRQDLVDTLIQEIEILMDYLPKQLTEEEIRTLVKDAVEKTGAKEIKEMGKVMGVLMPKVKGKADGKLVNEIVREFLK